MARGASLWSEGWNPQPNRTAHPPRRKRQEVKGTTDGPDLIKHAHQRRLRKQLQPQRPRASGLVNSGDIPSSVGTREPGLGTLPAHVSTSPFIWLLTSSLEASLPWPPAEAGSNLRVCLSVTSSEMCPSR